MGGAGRFIGTLLRIGFGLCALTLILLALYVSLGRQLVPGVAEYRAEVEARLSDALKQPVRLGALKGGWQGLNPVIDLQDLEVGEERQPLHLERIRVVPDVLRSLLHWQPRLDYASLDGVRLELIEEADGRWRITGLPQGEDEQKPFDPALLLKWLPSLGRLSVLNGQLSILSHEGKVFTLRYVEATLTTQSKGYVRLDGRLSLPDGQPLALDVQGQVNLAHWQDSQFKSYLSLPQTDWAQWIPRSLTRQWQLHELHAGGEVWLDWAHGEPGNAALRLNASRLVASYGSRAPAGLDDLALNLAFTREKNGWRAVGSDLAVSLGDRRWNGVTLAVQRDDAADRWQVRADRLDLAPLTAAAQALAPLPENMASAVSALSPHGALRNVLLEYQPQKDPAERLSFAANLEKVGFSAYHGAPAVENVSGSTSGGLEGGELKLDSTNFSLHLPTLFPEPWQYRTARARLNWSLSDDSFTLSSPLMRVSGEEGDASGDMFIRLARKPGIESYMDLRVGLRNGDARYTAKYLPTRTPNMSGPLADWLKTAIKSGYIEEGIYQYQGSLMHDAPPGARTMSLFFRVHDVQLAYQPGWPDLHEASGNIFIEDDAVRIQVPQGRILDTQVSNADISIPLRHDGSTVHLYLKGELDSSVKDGLKILQETPLPTAEIFKGWRGEGALKGSLDLDLPFDHELTPKVIIDFVANGARLQLANPALDVTNIRGAFRYDTTRGLSAPDIKAQVLGSQAHGKAFAEGNSSDPKTRLVAEGKVALTQLTQWLGVGNRPLPASGDIPYRLSLTLANNASEIVVASNLQGVAIDLPAPFGKDAQSAHDGFFSMTLDGPERRYEATYQGLADAVIAAPLNRLNEARGEVVLGDGTANLPAGQGIRVRGTLERLVLDEWQATIEKYVMPEKNSTERPGEGAAASGSMLSMLAGGQLSVGRFEGLAQTVDNLSAQFEPQGNAWTLMLDSSVIAGKVRLPDDRKTPITLALTHLDFPSHAAPAGGAKPVESPDPLADVDPHVLPAMDVSIDTLSLGGEPVGAQRLKIRPTAAGVRFSDLNLYLKGLKVEGAMDWEGLPGATRTRYSGRLSGDNVADVLLAWKLASSVTSRAFRLDANVNWPGSPAWAGLNRLSGTLDASLRDGQLRQVEGSASALRVFGLLNFEAIRRRLRLDFSDIFGRGLSYDTISGLLDAQNGVFLTRKPIVMDGPSTDMQLQGTLDLAHDQVDARLQVGLPLTNSLPIAALIVGAPAIGGALFIVDRLIGDRVTRMASVNYHIHGPWQNPQITLGKK
jgi:uncharacterized protein (TIGR02099 family)